MEALARFAMRSRINAIICVLLANMIPMTFFLGSACAALIILRKGFKEGSIVFFYAMLPALIWLSYQSPGPLLCLLGTVLLAVCLRRTMHWSAALMLLVPIAICTVGILTTLYSEFLNNIIQQLKMVYPDWLSYVMQNGAEPLIQEEQFVFLWGLLLKGYIIFVLLHIVVSIFLARYWQSILYNPGGLKQEFYQFKWPLPWLLCLLLGMMITMWSSSIWLQACLPGFLIPLLLAGLALGHDIIAAKSGQYQKICIILMYLFLLFVYPLFIVIACYDSLFDLRKKVRS
ncbi:MAG: hypothetical protein HAW62_04065 [Endozoicomonadaceae bacterium]|nr:hypothetical protein [Endozoicomonadaceae bacterium]